MAQMQINMSFDLGTASGRTEFQQIFGHLLVPGIVPGERVPGTFPNTGSSIPDDPVRAAAALAGRQEAAAKARAAKAAKAAGAAGPEGVNRGLGSLGPLEGGPLVRGPTEDLAGPDGANGDATDPADDLGLADPSMSPGEAKDAGLALVRQMYAAGKVTEVKALQKRWAVAKFYDVPLERAHEFYGEALKISHATMGQGAPA
jgi:hypothetical protein